MSVIGGVALAGVARSRRGRVDDALAIGGTTAIAIATQEESDRIRGLSIGADVLFASGILFGATALVLAFTTDWDGDEGEASEQARVRFTFDGAVDRDGFDLRLGGSF